MQYHVISDCLIHGHCSTVYPKKYAHGFCFAVLCCGYTLTDFPISIRLTSLALWQSDDCPSASKATLMNMDKYFMWIHYERFHNHNKAKHNKTVCIFLGIYCKCMQPSYWVSVVSILEIVSMQYKKLTICSILTLLHEISIINILSLSCKYWSHNISIWQVNIAPIGTHYHRLSLIAWPGVARWW